MQNCFVIYRKLFLSFIASKNLKPFFTLDYVLKRANDLKTKKKSGVEWCLNCASYCIVQGCFELDCEGGSLLYEIFCVIHIGYNTKVQFKGCVKA